MDKVKKIWFSVAVVLAVIGLTGCLVSIQKDGDMLTNIIKVILLFLIVLYMLFGYQKPHGNLLKWTMLIYAFALPVIVIPTVGVTSIGFITVLILEVMIITYVAGRLHKFNNNIILLSIVLPLLIVPRVVRMINGTIGNEGLLSVFSEVLVLVDIFIAYVIRFKEHKEAGLLDAPKKEK